MRTLSLKTWFALALVIVGVFLAGSAGAEQINLNALVAETQKMSERPDEMTLAWWIPEEFWTETFHQTPEVTASQTEEFLKTIRPYTMVIVVDGTVGSFGGITYRPEEEIRAYTRLVDAHKKSYAPLGESDIGADTKNMLQMIRPVLVNALGPMGQNMHFLLFPAATDSGTRIANPKEKGEFSVKLRDNEFKWRLPLDALLSTKVCPSCKQECKGSWSYCPWCGTKLSQK